MLYFIQIFTRKSDEPGTCKIHGNSRPGIETVQIPGNSRSGIPDGLGLAIVTISSPDHVIGNGDRRKNLYMIHTIFNMLSTQPFVRVFALDFSKAFDTVRHSTLMGKMARLALPDTAGVRQGLGGAQHPLSVFPAPVLMPDLSTPIQHPLVLSNFQVLLLLRINQ